MLTKTVWNIIYSSFHFISNALDDRAKRTEIVVLSKYLRTALRNVSPYTYSHRTPPGKREREKERERRERERERERERRERERGEGERRGERERGERREREREREREERERERERERREREEREKRERKREREREERRERERERREREREREGEREREERERREKREREEREERERRERGERERERERERDGTERYGKPEATHAGGEQLLQRRPGDVGEVLHEVPGGAENPQHLLVGPGDELEAADRGQALHVVAVDLRARHLVPGRLRTSRRRGRFEDRYLSARKKRRAQRGPEDGA